MHLTELGLRDGFRPAFALAHPLTLGMVLTLPGPQFPHLYYEGLTQSRDFKGGKYLRAVGPQLHRAVPYLCYIDFH